MLKNNCSTVREELFWLYSFTDMKYRNRDGPRRWAPCTPIQASQAWILWQNKSKEHGTGFSHTYLRETVCNNYPKFHLIELRALQNRAIKCNRPRFFPVPPLVLKLLIRETRTLSFIHSLANLIYCTKVALRLGREIMDDWVSSTISYGHTPTSLTPSSNANLQYGWPSILWCQLMSSRETSEETTGCNFFSTKRPHPA